MNAGASDEGRRTKADTLVSEWFGGPAAQAAVDRAVAERQADEAIVATAGLAGALADPGKRPPRPPSPPVPPPLDPGTSGPAPPNATAGTYQTGQGPTSPVGTTASVSMADLPTDDEPVRNSGRATNLFTRTGKNRNPTHYTGPLPANDGLRRRGH